MTNGTEDPDITRTFDPSLSSSNLPEGRNRAGDFGVAIPGPQADGGGEKEREAKVAGDRSLCAACARPVIRGRTRPRTLHVPPTPRSLVGGDVYLGTVP